MRTLIAITLALLPLLAAGAFAQETPAPAAAGAPALHGASGAAPADAGPVVVPPADERTMSFYRSGNLLFLGNYIVAALVSVLVLFTGWSARMRTFAMKIGRYWFLAIPIYLTIFAIIDSLVGLPLAYYKSIRGVKFGLEEPQTLGHFLQGEMGALLGGIVFVSILMLAFYTALRWSPRRWWIYVALPVFLIDVGTGVRDYYLEGRKFTAVEDKQLEAQIRSLAERAGVHNAKIVQAASGHEADEGPSVSGWMNDSRIVVASPAKTQLSREEQLFLTARQLGAYRMKHETKRDLLRSLLSILSFYLLYRTSTWLIARYKDRWGFDQLSDFASWPLFPVLFNIFFLLVLPLSSAYARHVRHDADVFALELARDNQACSQSFVALATAKIANPNPGPIYRFWRAADPPLAERMELCRSYRPWEEGRPLQHGDLISGEQKQVERR